MTGYRLSANLEYMFTEAGDELGERVRAAAAAGFDAVEMFYTQDRDVAGLRKVLADEAVQMWTVLVDPRTMLVDPATHDGFVESFRRTAQDARTLGCPHVVVGSGMAVPYRRRSVQLATVAEAVERVIPIADDLDLTILLEAVNTRVDHPGVLFSRTEDSTAVARAVDSPRVRLLYDLYHSVVEREDPAEVLPGVADLLGHVQIADVPGRGEPGSGEIDWDAAFSLLRKHGYDGVVGVECVPSRTPTAEVLGFIREVAARAAPSVTLP